MKNLFRPSGGLLYHARAIQRRGLWNSFRADLADWLEQWKINRFDLILIGPSGGYTLPTPWLSSFDRVIAYDIDPLAGWLFHKRHGRVNVEFRRQDVFWSDHKLSILPLQKILNENPSATILFCNVLGQILLEGNASEAQWLAYLQQLRQALHQRDWASYHDLYTIEPLPQGQHSLVTKSFARNYDIEKAVKAIAHGPVEITDHMLNGEWTRNTQKTVLAWSLTPTSLHLTEAVHSP